MTVHPHTRGDSAGRTACSTGHGGSPPHAWGQLNRDLGRHAVERFTPTRVGTATPTVQASMPRPTVHPHTRGDSERPRPIRLRCAVHPHTRGDNALDARGHALQRAVHPHTRGDSFGADVQHAWSTVHPHTRGDSGSGDAASRHMSVHPHTRGDSRSPLTGSTPWRFTPTRVGTAMRALCAVLEVSRFTPTRVGTATDDLLDGP